LTLPNSSFPSITNFSLLSWIRQILIVKSQNSSAITWLTEKPSIYGTIFLLHSITLMLELDKDWLFLLFYLHYTFPQFFHILENCLKNLKISISFLSFVDDGLFISQNKSLSISNANLFCSYNVVLSLLIKFSFVMKHSKTEFFHFSRLHGAFTSPLLDLSSLGRPCLLPKTTWKYLGFIFYCKLLFQAHIDFYANKAISTIKCMKMLRNSTRSLIPLQKQHLYKCCMLPIVLYSF